MEVKNWKECLSSIRACINFVAAAERKNLGEGIFDDDVVGAEICLEDAEGYVESVLVDQGEENP